MNDARDDFVDPAAARIDPESRYGFTGGDILHPSDLTRDEGRAFAHALAIALRVQATLTLLHAGGRGKIVDGNAFPHVRETLIRWGLLDRGASQDDVFDELGVDVRKFAVSGSPLQAIEDHLVKRPTDLVIMASGTSGLPRWLGSSVSEKLVNSARARTIYVPRDGRGFVDLADGSITLRRIVVPLHSTPDPRVGLFVAPRLAKIMGQEDVEFVAVHVDDGSPAPDIELPDDRWSWERRSGAPADVILEVANERNADVILMATEGRQGMHDIMRGSTTARVLRKTPCPVAAIPARLFKASEGGAG